MTKQKIKTAMLKKSNTSPNTITIETTTTIIILETTIIRTDITIIANIEATTITTIEMKIEETTDTMKRAQMRTYYSQMNKLKS